MSRPLRTQKGKEKRKKKFAVVLVGLIVTVGAIVGGLSWASSLPSLAVSQVEVNGVKAIDAASIKESALAALSGKYYFLFPRSNAFLYPRKEIEKKLVEDFPRAENISVSLKGLNTLEVLLIEREPAYLLCAGENENVCFFLDEQGFVFDKAPSFSGNAYFTFVRSSASSAPSQPVGSYFLETSLFQSLAGLVSAAKKSGFTPTKAILRDDSYAELFFREGWKIKFLSDMLAADFSNNLDSFARSPKWEKALKGDATERGKLLYLDFRFGDKVYYKFASKP